MASVFKPGAAIHGNFINYYSFNPAQNRLKIIPTSLLLDLGLSDKEKILALDIGCNAGNMSWELYQHITQFNPELTNNEESSYQDRLFVLGIDLDCVLIERCKESNPFPSNISFSHLDFMDSSMREQVLKNYLKTHGTKETKFDMIFAFSITMWIHLNHGDEGLFQFLSIISNLCNFLLLESHTWSSYLSAQRRLRRLGQMEIDEKINSILVRNDVDKQIEEYLESKCKMEKVNVLGKTNWKRTITIYKSTN